MTKLFFAAILLITSLTLGFSFDKRANKSTLSLEAPNCNICDSVEVRGLVTINGRRSTISKEPFEDVTIDIYLEEDAAYVRTKADTAKIKSRRVFNYTTGKDGIFSLKLAKGNYFLVVNYDEIYTDSYYCDFQIDEKDKTFDFGDIKLYTHIVIVGFDDSEFFNRKIIREKRKKEKRDKTTTGNTTTCMY